MTFQNHSRIAARANAGFSMVEVLVSIVILSFGLLGMVGLQAAALNINRDARLQSAAIVLAREMAEMMRGNKDVALLAAANPYLAVGQLSSPLVAPTPTYCLSVGSTCTNATQAAQAQVTDWLARVDAELPGAKVAICRDTAPYLAGIPQWGCSSAATTDPILVKIGWTIAGAKAGSAVVKADKPSVILPLTPGNAQ